jgi:hypothetical protein
MRDSKAHQRQGFPLTESNALMADRANEGALNLPRGLTPMLIALATSA